MSDICLEIKHELDRNPIGTHLPQDQKTVAALGRFRLVNLTTVNDYHGEDTVPIPRTSEAILCNNLSQALLPNAKKPDQVLHATRLSKQLGVVLDHAGDGLAPRHTTRGILIGPD